MKLKFTLPDGRSGTVEGVDIEDAKANFNRFVYPDMMRRQEDKEPVAEPPPPPARKGPTKEKLAADLEADRKKYDPAEGMPWYEKAAVGFQSGLRNAATGAGSLVGLADESDIQERKDREKRNEPLGNWGKAGTLTGEMAATLPVGMGASGAAAKVLSKALDAEKLAAVGNFGGKIFNLRNAGSAAVQSGVQEGLVGKADDKGDVGERLKEAGTAAAVGGAIPLGAGLVVQGGKILKNAIVGTKNLVMPSATNISDRAYKAIQDQIGDEGIVDARRAMEHAGPPTIPQTSAAMSQSAPLGALERGARKRGNVDFNAHDEAVARAAWEGLQARPGMGSEAGDVMRAGFLRNGQVQTGRQFGEAPNIVPDVTSGPLRKALGKLGPHMHPDEVDMGTAIANDLAKKDLVRYGQGEVTPNVARWVDNIPLAISSLIHAKSFGASVVLSRARTSAFNSLKGTNQDKVMKEIDEALLDPQKFQTLVDEARARILGNEPLSPKMEAVKDIAENVLVQHSRLTATDHTK